MTQTTTEERKVAVVTGAAGAMGAAIARAFAGEGYSLALIDVNADALGQLPADEAFADVEVATIVRDLAEASSCTAAIDETLAKLGRIDALVNNAGIGSFASLVEVSDHDMDAVMGINARAPMLLTRAVLPHMLARGSGAIVSMSSAAAKFGYADLAPYSASKAAVIGFTRALAVELATTGIRVNAVCPGPTNTAMMDANVRKRMAETGESYATALTQWTKDIPTKRMIEPEHVAQAVLFLATDRSTSITGEALNVSGGMVMW